jgi:effector-binding domain-containing protein
MTEATRNEPELTDVAEVTTAVVADVVEMSHMSAFFDQAFSTLAHVLASQGIEPIGPAFALHRRPVTDTADLEVGFPTQRPVLADGPVHSGSLPAGPVARFVHHGSFDGLPGAWQRLESWIGEQGLTPGDAMWEVYLTEPSPDMDPADLQTELNWPVRRPGST